VRRVQSGALRIPAAAVGLWLAASATVLAARTDIIVLRNGDRVTGEVVSMRQGKLQVKTDDAGTLSIEWDKVTAVTTAARYDISLRDGTMLFGRITPGAPRVMQVVVDLGAIATIQMADVVSFAAIKTKFFERIDGSLDLGASYTKSSGVAQLSFDTEAKYRRPSYGYGASLSTNLTRQPDSPDTARYAFDLTYTRYRSQWLVSSFGLFEGNRDLGFTFRGTGALTLGRYLRRSSHMELLVAGGLAAGREAPVGADVVTNVDAVTVADLSVFAYDYPSTRVDVAVLVFPSLDGPGRVRVNTNGKVKRELFRDFYFAVSAYDAFDNRPKSGSTQQNDFGASISFGWSF
jgi:hypothetical protein